MIAGYAGREPSNRSMNASSMSLTHDGFDCCGARNVSIPASPGIAASSAAVIGSFIIVGAVFFLVPFLVGLLGFIEGVIYLTKSDADFQREYITGKKAWL